MIDHAFWRGKTVFLTGHTGFKGGWLALWLQSMGAHVVGFSLAPSTSPNLFDLAHVADGMTSIIGDVRAPGALRAAMVAHHPEIVFHLAAQAIVRRSYVDPAETYATNVMGTVHMFEAVRQTPSARVVLNVTSDKCYENRDWQRGYRESDAMGGFDPYSSSKGCSELITASYRRSFFSPSRETEHPVAVASARAGNVIGGGDWAEDRLVPDLMRAIMSGTPATIRYPGATRPWQHVLEPLSGYLILAQKLWTDHQAVSEGWNFGPLDQSAQPVSYIADRITKMWGEGARWTTDGDVHPHEARYLNLDCSKATARLGWRPRWNLDQTLELIVGWYRDCRDGRDMRAATLRQIEQYEGEAL